MSIFMLLSCNKPDSLYCTPENVIWSYYEPYKYGFVAQSYVISSFYIDHYSSREDVDNDRFVCITKERYKVKYDSISKAIGDVNNKKRMFKGDGQGYILHRPISSIDVTVDRDFDQNHLAGSNVNDIFDVIGVFDIKKQMQNAKQGDTFSDIPKTISLENSMLKNEL